MASEFVPMDIFERVDREVDIAEFLMSELRRVARLYRRRPTKKLRRQGLELLARLNVSRRLLKQNLNTAESA